jgi:hypothetical protein
MAALQPLPQPGLPLIPGFTATAPTSFLTKARSPLSGRAAYSVFYSSPAGEEGAPFLDIFQDHKDTVSFRTPQGQEVMRIVKENSWSSWKTNEYLGVRGDGVEVWRLKVKSGWTGTEYGE